MSDTVRMWIEVIFNVSYLVVVWALVIAMLLQKERVAPQNQKLANLFIATFGLLALGDTGHVGFRVVAYALGSLEARMTILGLSTTLVGLGTLATAITVTLFYVLMLEIWRVRFNRRYGWFEYFLMAMGLVRLVVMALPGNQWDALVPPQPIGIIRNLFLMVQGLGLAYLILRDAFATQDKTFKLIGAMILASYACYIPVILFSAQVPLLGMLMIPKTMAYVAIAFIGYFDLYGMPKTQPKKALGVPAN